MGQSDLVDDSANPYQPPAFQAVVVDRRGTDTVGIDLAAENPFLTIWTRPRATIRGLIDADSVRRVLPLVLAAIVLGIWDALTRANGPRHFRGTDLAMAMVLGPLKSLATLYLGGWFLTITGRWLGGKGTSREVHLALAWSCVPVALADALGLVETALGVPRTITPRMVSVNPLLAIAEVGLLVVQFQFMAWWVVILFKGVAEAHRFSVLKAIGSLVVIYLIAVAVFAVVYAATMAIPGLQGYLPWRM